MVDSQMSRRSGRAAKPLFWALILGGLGSLFVAGGLYEVVQARDWVRGTVPARAVVEEAHPYTDSEDDPLYEATVLFETADGEQASVLVREECHFFPGQSLEPGRTVSIRYDPANPTSAGLASWSTLWGDPTVFLGLGAVFLAGAAALFVAAGRAMRHPNPPTPLLLSPHPPWSNEYRVLEAGDRRRSGVSRARQGRL